LAAPGWEGEERLRDAYTREQLEGSGMYRATFIIRLVAYVGSTRMGGEGRLRGPQLPGTVTPPTLQRRG
jgi:hypothetical protein